MKAVVNTIIAGGLIVLIMVLFDNAITLKDIKNRLDERGKPEFDSITIDSQYNQPATRGFNFKEGKGYFPTDEEIRELRRQHPEYIIKVPGRQVKNQRQLTEQQIEEYIEDHPETLDQYRD